MPRSGSRTAAERARAERAGRIAETIAAWFLRLKGYKVRARRVRTPVGELDIVAERGLTLVFVEVKARTNRSARDMALGAVNRHRIAAAASAYMSRHPDLSTRDARFDIILIAPWTLPVHVRNAFLTTPR